MSIRALHTLPVSSIIDDDNESLNFNSEIQYSYVMQNNLKFLSSDVAGNDGTVYGFVNSTHRTGYVNSSFGRSGGHPAGINGSQHWFILDQVGHAGAYLLKLGYGTEVNHRWLRGVVGFDAKFSLWGVSQSSVNHPWIGKIGLVYVNPLNGQEFIYRPTVTMKGPTGDLSEKKSGHRVARKFSYKGEQWNDINELNLLFTGIIFEYGHSSGGGIVETELYLYIQGFKPIICESKTSSNPASKSLSNIQNFEVLPRLRSFDQRNDIEYDTIN